jgi:hypothetical protein
VSSGFEETFAPEIALFATSPYVSADPTALNDTHAPLASADMPLSWLPATKAPSRPLSPTGPGATANLALASAAAAAAAAHGANRPGSGRSEKGRFSLTFLKRTSIGDGRRATPAQNLSNLSNGHGNHTSSGGLLSGGGIAGPHHLLSSEDRSGSALAFRSGSAAGTDKDSGIRGRVGSVKKRLSHLSLAGKWGRGLNSAAGGREDPVMEEGEG